MQQSLNGRVVLVTGASSGLGARFGRVLAENGARVVLAARRKSNLERLAAEISAGGGAAAAVEMDVADEGSTKAAYDAAERAFGPVDTVIANAGMNVEGDALEMSAEDFDAILRVNVRGVFLTIREGARRMIANGAKERRHGRIIIVSSITANSISPGTAPYSASKAAVQQMGRVLAREWAARGVNVNSICPGYIRTDINADWFDTPEGAKQVARWPRRRLMSEEGLDGMVLFLAGDASAEVTGASFTLDDGQSLASV